VKRILPFVALLALVGCDSGGAPAALGSVASDFKVETLSLPSSSASLQTKRGKVVLLDFWATWCGPCRQISPALEDIYDRFKADGLEAMAITSEAREIVQINEKNRPHKLPVYLDPKESAWKAFGIMSLPTIIVVGRDGRIVYQTSGISASTPAEISDAVATALGKA
jgi:cytochrome c biogenesis protein CcmG/thiol:disulfide interchange protein DsbE